MWEGWDSTSILAGDLTLIGEGKNPWKGSKNKLAVPIQESPIYYNLLKIHGAGGRNRTDTEPGLRFSVQKGNGHRRRSDPHDHGGFCPDYE